MRYTILLEKHPDGTYEASIPAMPEITERGDSRAEAIAAIEHAIRSGCAMCKSSIWKSPLHQ